MNAELLREVEFAGGYRLTLWDTNKTTRQGNSVLQYAFYTPTCDAPLFEGADFGASPMHAIDSDETLRSLLGFLTLRPGDTDAEYFNNYTPAQMDFAKCETEYLQCELEEIIFEDA